MCYFIHSKFAFEKMSLGANLDGYMIRFENFFLEFHEINCQFCYFVFLLVIQMKDQQFGSNFHHISPYSQVENLFDFFYLSF